MTGVRQPCSSLSKGPQVNERMSNSSRDGGIDFRKDDSSELIVLYDGSFNILICSNIQLVK